MILLFIKPSQSLLHAMPIKLITILVILVGNRHRRLHQSVSLTSSFYAASRMRLHEQAPETSLGAEVDHQTSLLVDAHAGRIQRPWTKTHAIALDSTGGCSFLSFF